MNPNSTWYQIILSYMNQHFESTLVSFYMPTLGTATQQWLELQRWKWIGVDFRITWIINSGPQQFLNPFTSEWKASGLILPYQSTCKWHHKIFTLIHHKKVTCQVVDSYDNCLPYDTYITFFISVNCTIPILNTKTRVSCDTCWYTRIFGKQTSVNYSNTLYTPNMMQMPKSNVVQAISHKWCRNC